MCCGAARGTVALPAPRRQTGAMLRLAWRYAPSIAALALCACGGGSMPATTASDCFNPQLFAPGTAYSLDYKLTGNPGGTLSQVTSVQASPATGPADVVVVTTTDAAFNPPVPGTIVLLPDRRRYVQALEGTDIVTKDEFELAPTWTSEFESPFDPFLRDRRFGLAPGASF